MKPAGVHPNRAIETLRTMGVGVSAFVRAAQLSMSFGNACYKGTKKPGPDLAKKIEGIWPTVLRDDWSKPADVRGEDAATALASRAPRTSAGGREAQTPIEMLREGAMTNADTHAVLGVELRRLKLAVVGAVGEAEERDLVCGHIGYRKLRAFVVEFLAPDPDLQAEAHAALPEAAPDGPLDVLRTSLRELGELRVWLEAQRARALSDLSFAAANKLDANLASVTRLEERARMRNVRPEDLLKSDTWQEIVIAMCAVMRGQDEALEDLQECISGELRDGNPFAISLTSALATVRHITWPAARYADDPHAFFREILGVELYDKQAEILDAFKVRDAWIAVRSGHRIGKSLLVAGVALWFYSSFPRARCFLVAPTDHQLQDIDWREIRVRLIEAGVCLACKLKNQAAEPEHVIKAPCPHSALIDGVLRETARAGMHAPDLRHITGVSVRQPEAIAGLAGANMCFIVDEASGVPKPIMTALKGNLAGGGFFFLVGNPTQPEGEFFDAFHPKKDPESGEAESLYKTFTISSLESPNARAGLRRGDPGFIEGLATREWCDARLREWGADSEDYAVRVKGIHYFGTSNRLLSVQLLIDAEERWRAGSADDESGPLVVAIDAIGGEGGVDDMGLAVRRGWRIIEVAAEHGPLTEQQQVDRVWSAHKRFARKPHEFMIVVIDVEGVGFKVAQRLEVWAADNPGRIKIMRVRASSKSRYDPRVYHLERDGLAGYFATWLTQGGALPPDLMLNGELRVLQMTSRITAQGERRKLIEKKEIRKQIHRSPDRYDACAMAVYADFHTDYAPADDVAEEPEAQAHGGAIVDGKPNPYAGSINPYG